MKEFLVWLLCVFVIFGAALIASTFPIESDEAEIQIVK